MIVDAFDRVRIQKTLGVAAALGVAARLVERPEAERPELFDARRVHAGARAVPVEDHQLIGGVLARDAVVGPVEGPRRGRPRISQPGGQSVVVQRTVHEAAGRARARVQPHQVRAGPVVVHVPRVRAVEAPLGSGALAVVAAVGRGQVVDVAEEAPSY